MHLICQLATATSHQHRNPRPSADTYVTAVLMVMIQQNACTCTGWTTSMFDGKPPGVRNDGKNRTSFWQVGRILARNFGSITRWIKIWEASKQWYYISYIVASRYNKLDGWYPGATIYLPTIMHHGQDGWYPRATTYLPTIMYPSYEHNISIVKASRRFIHHHGLELAPPFVLLQSHEKLTRAWQQHSNINQAFDTSLHKHLHTKVLSGKHPSVPVHLPYLNIWYIVERTIAEANIFY